MINKRLAIKDTRERIGWAYDEMKWLSEAEAKKANQERNELLQSISGRVNSYFFGNKIGLGHLSPGCMNCGQGTWSCLFIGSLCTANCFYCPQDRKTKKDEPPTESGLLFDNPGDYVDYLEKFKFRGVSFSGGEPFLKFENIISYIRKIRERLGNGIYIWIYTNGDLVDRNKLSTLKEVGLNEIRFDIAARDYDLKAVELSVGIIDKVTVEVPAIPEDYEILKKCLHRMQEIGVAHLNLHQLYASQYCYKQFIDRRYTFLHQPEIAVLESEMTALRLIKYALENKIGLAINYCSAIYKYRLQRKGYKDRIRSFIEEGHEGLTESGFIRNLAIQGSLVNIKKLINKFQENKCHDRLWFFKKEGPELLFHHSLLKYIDINKQGVILTYFAPQLTADRVEEHENNKEIVLNSGRNVVAGKKLVYQTKMTNATTIRSFQELFIGKMNSGDVLKRFYRDYDLKTKASINDMMNEKDHLNYLKTWELIGSGTHEIY